MLTLLQTDSYNGVDAVSGAAGAGLGIGSMFMSLLIYLFYGYCMFKIFKKQVEKMPGQLLFLSIMRL